MKATFQLSVLSLQRKSVEKKQQNYEIRTFIKSTISNTKLKKCQFTLKLNELSCIFISF